LRWAFRKHCYPLKMANKLFYRYFFDAAVNRSWYRELIPKKDVGRWVSQWQNHSVKSVKELVKTARWKEVTQSKFKYKGSIIRRAFTVLDMCQYCYGSHPKPSFDVPPIADWLIRVINSWKNPGTDTFTNFIQCVWLLLESLPRVMHLYGSWSQFQD
jgi:hypothetical protein